MKKIIKTVLLSLLALNCFSQQVQTMTYTKASTKKKFESWWDLNNGKIIDNNFIKSEIGKDHDSDTIYFSHFNFNIPSNSKILGIELKLVRLSFDARNEISDKVICITSKEFNSINQANSMYWDTIKTEVIFGSKSDLWGRNFTPELVNDSLFGFILQTNPTSKFYRSAWIDYVEIKVFYDNTTDLLTFEKNSSILLSNIIQDLIEIPARYTNDIKSIEIFSTSGVIMITSNLFDSTDISNFPPGIYFLRIKLKNDRIVTKKILKE